MSMILGLVALSDTNVDRVLRDPPLIWRVIAPGDADALASARGQHRPRTLLSRLFGRRRQAPSNSDVALSPGEGAATDIDKAWHGIHYLLTGTAWEGEPPLNFLVSGGRPVGDIDVGYGPARVLTASETRRARDALAAVDESDLRARFDPADMTAKEIYPDIWERPAEEDDTLAYLIEHVGVLRACLDQACAKGLGLVVYLS